jgi:hypothetical protein
MTGSVLKNTPKENPLRMAYYLEFGSKFHDNPSWDQMTVLYAVRGASELFKQNTKGTGMLVNGYKWDFKDRNDSWLELLLPEETYAKMINDLMIESPQK